MTQLTYELFELMNLLKPRSDFNIIFEVTSLQKQSQDTELFRHEIKIACPIHKPQVL